MNYSAPRPSQTSACQILEIPTEYRKRKLLEAINVLLPVSASRSPRQLSALLFLADVEHLRRYQRPIFRDHYNQQQELPHSLWTRDYLKRVGYGSRCHPGILGNRKLIECTGKILPLLLSHSETICLEWTWQRHQQKPNLQELLQQEVEWNAWLKSAKEPSAMLSPQEIIELMQPDPETDDEEHREFIAESLELTNNWLRNVDTEEQLPTKTYQRIELLTRSIDALSLEEKTSSQLDSLIRRMPQDALNLLRHWPTTTRGNTSHLVFLERIALNLPGAGQPLVQTLLETTLIEQLQNNHPEIGSYLDLAAEIGIRHQQPAYQQALLKLSNHIVRNPAAKTYDHELLVTCLHQLTLGNNSPKVLPYIKRLQQNPHLPSWLQQQATTTLAKILHRYPEHPASEQFCEQHRNQWRHQILKNLNARSIEEEILLKEALTLVTARSGPETTSIGRLLQNHPPVLQVYCAILRHNLENYQQQNNGHGHPWLRKRSKTIEILKTFLHRAATKAYAPNTYLQNSCS